MLEAKLGLKPFKIINESDTYLKVSVKGRADKIIEAGQALSCETIIKEGGYFKIESRSLTDQEKTELMKKREVELVIKKERSLYETGAARVIIDRIEDLGTFIVIESEKASATEQAAKKLGFDSPQFVVYPDDILKR